MRACNRFLATLAPLLVAALVLSVVADETVRSHHSDISQMKQSPRGPFSRIRWFCNDGTVLAPEPYACTDHGGGVQHGDYSPSALALRNAGYPVATLLADLAPADFVDDSEGLRLLKFMLLEQFLVGFDDGWIFRRARFYRGAIQHEDEQRSGQMILESLAAQLRWSTDRFLLLREAVRLLPHHTTLITLSDVRGRAASISEADPNFRSLRGKIHGSPDAADARRVREYARTTGRAEMAEDYAALARAIEQAYTAHGLPDVLKEAASTTTLPSLRQRLHALAAERGDTAQARLTVASAALVDIRNSLPAETSPAARVGLLDASLELERITFVASRTLSGFENVTRQQRLQWMKEQADALYGVGLITRPEHRQVGLSLAQLAAHGLTVSRYQRELRQLGMVSQWASRRIWFVFGLSMERLNAIEPLAQQYLPDRLRGSPLLDFDLNHGTLAVDMQMLAGVQHELFGETLASGLRTMNPGLARGVLKMADHTTPLSDYDPRAIYIVPETLAQLPPVAGILTRSEGNALSHVQLLARSLGIPNVVIADEILAQLEVRVGRRIVLASSRGGVVRVAEDSSQWDSVFVAEEDAERSPLRIDVDKLDLSKQDLYPLSKLRAYHSGRVAGPKAAKLGELMHQFPGDVSAGLVLPFGIYRALLEQPVEPGSDLTMFAWMEQRYAELAAVRTDEPASYGAMLTQTLAFIRNWVLAAPLPHGLEDTLRLAMQAEFGPQGSYGVFVRSDTNVEDLPNFSGAGLNLTVPNVVGFDETLAAIRRVWASPFTERAFSWRQNLMDQPQHVYASVLLQVGVAADKSGVMVTKDVDSGERDVLTVVANEGVGGGVDGQLAETLKISLVRDEVRRESSATATQRAVLSAKGGVTRLPVSERDVVLDDRDIETLRELARLVPQRVVEFSTDQDETAPAADVEFGFKDGKLWLFQVRPFVESGTANRNTYLNALDAALTESAQRPVDLTKRLIGVGT